MAPRSRARPAGIARLLADPFVRAWGEGLRVLIVAGVPVGVIVAGVGSRLAMMLLRLTSSDGVGGITSDDGFTIGEVTLAGTYNLLLLGATIGIIGAAGYQWVAPWLIGPTWFHRLTTGAGSAVVVGSMLLHADGVDFRLLKPTWLAIGLFIALPGLFGVVIGPVVDRVQRQNSWTARGRRRIVIPVVLVVLFPLVIVTVLLAAFVYAAWLAVRSIAGVTRLRSSLGYGIVMRIGWLSIAVLGLIALVNDITAIV